MPPSVLGKKWRSGSVLGDHLVKRFDLSTSNELADVPLGKDACYTMRFDPKGNRLVTVQWLDRPMMKVWNLKTAVELFTLDGFSSDQTYFHNDGEVRFTPDGRRLVTAGDGTVKIWDALDGQLLLTVRPVFSPCRVSATGLGIAAAGPTGSVCVWQAPAFSVPPAELPTPVAEPLPAQD
jgi:WD40 repeat protein